MKKTWDVANKFMDFKEKRDFSRFSADTGRSARRMGRSPRGLKGNKNGKNPVISEKTRVMSGLIQRERDFCRVPSAGIPLFREKSRYFS